MEVAPRRRAWRRRVELGGAEQSVGEDGMGSIINVVTWLSLKVA